MKIHSINWNSFVVPLERKVEETEERYSEKTFKCLEEFYKQFAESPTANINHLKKATGGNFCDFYLKGIFLCDVKYNIYSDRNGRIPTGIWVHSHPDPEVKFKPMIDFVRGLWETFSYDV